MTWNLRLVNLSTPYEDYFEIREVFYDLMGKPMGHTKAGIGGEDRAEIDKYMEMVKVALEKPTLTFASDK